MPEQNRRSKKSNYHRPLAPLFAATNTKVQFHKATIDFVEYLHFNCGQLPVLELSSEALCCGLRRFRSQPTTGEYKFLRSGGYEQPCALEFPERDTTINLRLALPGARYRATFLAMVEARGRLPIEAAADLNCLSPSRFSHDFRARLGRPFRDVQFVVRMELTAHTLLRTHWRLSEIADAFGYSELKHWDAAFARHFGVCPRQYRARFTSESDSFKDYCRFFNYSRSTGNSSSSTGNK